MQQEKGLVAELMSALRCLPGVGPKSAQRMAFHLLQQDRSIAKTLASAMQDAAEALGLSAKESRLLVLQTAFGAAKLALESSDDAGVLRQRVTSKGGTTEAALKELIDGGLPELFDKALKAAENRSKELKKLYLPQK